MSLFRVTRWRMTALVVVLLLAGAASGFTQSTGTVTGLVRLSGTSTPPRVTRVSQDAEVCGREIVDDSLLVSDGMVANAVVRVTSATSSTGSYSFGDPVIDQSGCQFAPHVLLMPPGPITFINSDGILHNVHLYTKLVPEQNVAMPSYRKTLTLTVPQPEFVRVTCDAHGWMAAYLIVAEHPYYAISASNGSFTLRNVPAGRQEIEFWHERLGTVTRTVTVPAGGTVQLDVALSSN